MSVPGHLRVATRRSELAVIQTTQWMDKIVQLVPDLTYELVEIDSAGDLQPERHLSDFGGKGIFSRTLEVALAEDKADLAIHSLKDLSVNMDPFFSLPALSQRGNPYDVLVTAKGRSLAELPTKAVAGTGSPRRLMQLKRHYPKWDVIPLRGNVRTRLDKLKRGDYDVIVLALAGLERLGIEIDNHPDFDFVPLNETFMVPACGQGILAIQTLSERTELNRFLASVADDKLTRLCYEAERSVVRHLGASCQAPVATFAKVEGEKIVLYAINGLGGVDFTREIREPVGDARTLELDEMKIKKALNHLTGKVYLVGAGPGDAGLFTLKGRELLETADAVVFDRLGTGELTGFINPKADRIYVGKRAGNHAMKQEQICELLVQLAREGKKTVRLKGGDPFVFGRGGEELLILHENGIPFEVVPGVTSSVAAPAYAGIPVTHRGLASSVHIITAHEGEGGKSDALDYDDLAKIEGTLVFMMGVKNLPHVAQGLLAAGKDPLTPCAMVSNGTLNRQKVLHSVLNNLVKDAEEAAIRPPAVIIVGEVAALGETINWFEPSSIDGPLAGKHILVTRSKPPQTAKRGRSFADFIEARGGVPFELSLIRLFTPVEMQEHLDHNLSLLFNIPVEMMTTDEKELLERLATAPSRWFILTSAHGVDCFFTALDRLQVDRRDLANWRFAVIGSATAAAVRSYGYTPDLLPKVFDSSHLTEALISQLDERDLVVAVRAASGSPVLPTEMARQGRFFLDLPAYDTCSDELAYHLLSETLNYADAVTFTSSSGVRAFVAGLENGGISLEDDIIKKLDIFAIGPVTAETCRTAGLMPTAVADVFTMEGLADTMARYYTKNRL
ncbi:MAG: uroporphyrinogen-III C-methyltransferase [Fastidiosipilaceae bacterium]|jgi:uroporphyrinogen III methyltransferase/synthase